MLESQIERAVCKHAKSTGWLVFKFVSPSHNGVPDRIFLKNGITIFVEFKRPGGKLSPLQIHVIGQLRNAGFDVHVIDDIPTGKEIFNGQD